MCRVGCNRRNEQVPVIAERVVIERSGFLAAGNVLVQMGQFGIQDSSLNSVQTAVYAYHIVVIAHHHPVIGNSLNTSRQCVIVGKQCTSVTVTAQVLAREETGTAYFAHCASLFACAVTECIGCSDSLTSIFHYIEVVFAGYIKECLHIGALTEQVNRNNGFRLRCDGTPNGIHIHIHRIPIHIHYNRSETQQCHHFSGSNKSESRSNHLVAAL